MPVVISPDSELGKELGKWNKPYVFRQFPQMLYMARKRPDGIVSVVEVDDALFTSPNGTAHPGAAEAFCGTCQRTVNNDAELAKALELGWRSSPAEALERFEAKEQSIGNAAAYRAYEDRNMSPGAKAEAKVVEDSTPDHVPEVPEQRRRGRPRKQAA
jgi:hypothetical protein